MCPWIGDDFDPQAFSIDQINRLAPSDAAPKLPGVAPSSSLRRLPETRGDRPLEEIEEIRLEVIACWPLAALPRWPRASAHLGPCISAQADS